MEITQELLKKLFDYHEDGYLIWKKRISANQNIGDRAGYYSEGNYGYVQFYNKTRKSSRMIFLWHNGYLPKVVDHEDRNKSNDRIKNLRAATIRQNNANVKSHVDSTSRYLGVYRHLGRYWLAFIRKSHKKQTKIGIFKTEIEAALAYNKEAVKYHGEFANLNIAIPWLPETEQRFIFKWNNYKKCYDKLPNPNFCV